MPCSINTSSSSRFMFARLSVPKQGPITNHSLTEHRTVWQHSQCVITGSNVAAPSSVLGIQSTREPVAVC